MAQPGRILAFRRVSPSHLRPTHGQLIQTRVAVSWLDVSSNKCGRVRDRTRPGVCAISVLFRGPERKSSSRTSQCRTCIGTPTTPRSGTLLRNINDAGSLACISDVPSEHIQLYFLSPKHKTLCRSKCCYFQTKLSKLMSTSPQPKGFAPLTSTI